MQLARRLAITVSVVAWVMFDIPAALASGHVFLMHDPLQPGPNQPVTFTVTADLQGIDSIVIHVEQRRFETANGEKHSVPTNVPDVLLGCNNPANGTCEKTTSGYPNSSHIRYWAEITANGQTEETGKVNFAAGTFPWPDDPIPIYVQRDQSQAIDLVFIPDKDYGEPGRSITDFTGHVANLINDSFFSSAEFAKEIRGRRDRWNFYLTYRQGDAEPPVIGCNLTPPENWTVLLATVNTGFVVHNACMKDCTMRGEGSLFSAERIPPPTGQDCPDADRAKVVPVHEAGHAVFSLSDEYKYAALFLSNLPSHNVFNSSKACRDNARAWGWPTNSCDQIKPKWWRSDPVNDIMEDAASVDRGPGPSDTERFAWKYSECESSRC